MAVLAQWCSAPLGMSRLRKPEHVSEATPLHSVSIRDSCQTQYKGAECNNILLDSPPDSHLLVLISFSLQAHLPVFIFMADLR